MYCHGILPLTAQHSTAHRTAAAAVIAVVVLTTSLIVFRLEINFDFFTMAARKQRAATCSR